MSTNYAVCKKNFNQHAESAFLEFKQINAMYSIQLWSDFARRFLSARKRLSIVDGVQNSTVNNVATGY